MFTPTDWQQRFEVQSAWTRDLRRYWIERMRLPADARVLEVGSGTGAIIKDTPFAPGTRQFGLDINFDYLRISNTNNPSAAHIQANGISIPFACSSFNLVYCHYLLLWLADPITVLREMRRVVSPQGFVAAFAEPDYGGRVDYPPPQDELGRAQTLALRAQGADPLIGRKLLHLFQQAGFSHVETGVIGAQWSIPQPDADAQSEEDMLRHDLAPLLTADRLEELLRANHQALRQNHRVLYLPTFYACAQV
jgi:ubiquinone/menaquinone biosynthesis C-methylase UbiE